MLYRGSVVNYVRLRFGYENREDVGTGSSGYRSVRERSIDYRDSRYRTVSGTDGERDRSGSGLRYEKDVRSLYEVVQRTGMS